MTKTRVNRSQAFVERDIFEKGDGWHSARFAVSLCGHGEACAEMLMMRCKVVRERVTQTLKRRGEQTILLVLCMVAVSVSR